MIAWMEFDHIENNGCFGFLTFFCIPTGSFKLQLSIRQVISIPMSALLHFRHYEFAFFLVSCAGVNLFRYVEGFALEEFTLIPGVVANLDLHCLSRPAISS